MNNRLCHLGLLIWISSAFFNPLFSQLEFKLKVQPDGDSWGVYVRPDATIGPSDQTITGSGQVTVIAPLDFSWENLESKNGLWIQNALVTGPLENPGMQYISFGLVNSEPQYPIKYIPGEETLLFTFESSAGCPDTLYLIDCNSPTNPDPFCIPNSQSTNPGNDLAVIDFGVIPTGFYYYARNYAQSAWSCADNDGDGIVNGQEDTNGNGVFDPFDDDSDLNDPNDPGTGIVGGLKYKLQLMPDQQSWGVYVKPNDGLNPSLNTMTASAKVSVVVPLGFEADSISSQSGLWTLTSTLEAPANNQDRTYLAFELLNNDPPISYIPDGETLLFTIHRTGDCPDSLYIVDQLTDPVALDCAGCVFNEITVADLGTSPAADYFFDGIYGKSAWSCKDCDGDGIPNAFEDTNGDGVYTPGVDVSQLCNPCDPVHPVSATLGYSGLTEGCIGDFDNAFLTVEVEGGWGPDYAVLYSDGTNQFFVPHYIPGSPIPVVPQNGAVYQLLSVVDNFACAVEAAGLIGSFQITVDGPVTFTQDPSDTKVCHGSEAIFEAQAMNQGGGDLQIRWEMSADGGLTWNLVTAAGLPGAFGMNTGKLVLQNATNLLHNYQFRAVAGSTLCDPVISQSATLQVEGPVSIDMQPADTRVCAGQPACFQVGTLDDLQGDLNFQWEIKSPGNTNWVLLNDNFLFAGSQTSSLCINSSTGLNGALLRVHISTALCAAITSEEARLYVDGPLVVQAQPQDLQLFPGEDASFSAGVMNFGDPSTAVSYQWQYSDDNGFSWHDLTDGLTGGSELTGSNTPNLSIKPADGLFENNFRLVASVGDCHPVYSQAASLQEKQSLIQMIDQPDDQITCENGRAAFSVSAQTSDGSQLEYQWEYSQDGVSWESITAGPYFNGIDNDTLLVLNVVGLDSFRFRCLVAVPGVSTLMSGSGLLEVEEMVSAELVSEDATVCPEEDHSFLADIDVPDNVSSYMLQWQMSDDLGNTWSDIQENQETGHGGFYQGVQSEMLAISKTAGLDQNKYRIIATTGSCISISEAVTLFVEDENTCSPAESLLEMKLSLYPDGSQWGVWIRAADGYQPSGYQKALAGRVTIAVSKDFNFPVLSSKAGGTWAYGSVLFNCPQTPDINYYTFNLTPNNNSIDLLPGEEIMLFAFNREGFCPDEMYLVDDFIPNGVLPNECRIIDLGNGGQQIGLGSIYGLGEADCSTMSLLIDQENGSVATESELHRQLERNSGSGLPPTPVIYPNPANDMITLSIPETMGSLEASCTIMTADGQAKQSVPVNSQKTELNLSGYPDGLYFIIYREAGKVVYRDKFVKR